MAPASVRKLVLRNAQQLERVQRVVDFMNRKVGRGWPRHMEMRDRHMDQDYPRLWLSGRKIVSRRSLRRLEEYAARFGFVVPTDTRRPPSRIDVLGSLDAL